MPASLTPAPGLPYTGRVTGKCAALLALPMVLLGASPSRAEHEVSSRYTVLGYITDAQGRARPGVKVELVREKTGFSYVTDTDKNGLYVIVARLGDESAGEALQLRMGRQSVKLRAHFDPKDHTHERGTRVDFVGGRSLETPTAFAATLKRFLAQ
ncbi:MAG TPA: carboxypeptidase-like regulatory domain-containing protein [Methylomirabilota bacterium]|nr:carboxypeptidase-like regulatory domain-containing protein [Methylomirabilota bacterium]